MSTTRSLRKLVLFPCAVIAVFSVIPFVAAADDTSTASGSSLAETTDQASQKKPQGLQEVVVTAQKREERLQDVPVPVTVISADTLVESGQPRVQDYFESIPGFNYQPSIYGQATFGFRGITNFSNANTVAIVLDDVPFSGAGFESSVIPDIDPGDLLRVETLRGPQGTLYGASSLGGLVKYVTKDPTTDALSGRVQADVSSVYHGAEPGYVFRGAINVPVTDTFAVRASAFDEQVPGYLDNPVLHINGVNEDHIYGGRVSALWQPSDIVSLKLSALYQDTKTDSENAAVVPTTGFPQTTGLGSLQQNYVAGCCGFHRQLEAYTGVLKAKLGIVDLTALSGYTAVKASTAFDYSYALGDIAQNGIPGTGFNGFGVSGAEFRDYGADYVFTQEIRALIPLGQRLEWLVGGFYEHDNQPIRADLPAVNPTTGALAGYLGHIVGGALGLGDYQEYAAFTNLTVQVTDRFDIQLGGRQSHQRVASSESTDVGPLFGLVTTPAVEATTNAFTYLVTPQFKFSPELMVYARIASGFRPGLTNNDPNPAVPRLVNPDKTENYEVGVKGDVLDHALSFDASLYYIDWKGMQTTLCDGSQCLYSFTANAGRARSEGVEISLQTKPLSGLTVSAWATYDDAVLTQAFPPSSTIYGPDGSRLPWADRFAGYLSIHQIFPIVGNISGSVGAQLSYVGDRLGQFLPSPSPGAPTPVRQVYPGYARLDLLAGLSFESWAANLYANNITDRRGVIGGGIGTTPPYAFYYIQPRTVGLSLTKNF